jgi:hypothetical protein
VREKPLKKIEQLLSSSSLFAKADACDLDQPGIHLASQKNCTRPKKPHELSGLFAMCASFKRM